MAMCTNARGAASSPSRIGRDLWIAVTIKLALLAVLYSCFFTDNHRAKTDPGATAAALLDRSTVNR
jgi:hypothetical protein